MSIEHRGKDWPHCCNLPMSRCNQLALKGHECTVCGIWLQEKEATSKQEKVVVDNASLYLNHYDYY